MATEVGLRERKKQQTRRRIADTAIRLFAERGFEHVRVAEVARGAEVSEATVFNYFPTKEDLVHDGMDGFEIALLQHLRERPPGVPVLAAFREFVLRPHSLAEHPGAVDRIAIVARIVADSPALRARERQVFDRFTDQLAELLTAEADSGAADGADTVTSWVVANALMGLNRALKDYVHAGALAGRSGPDIADGVLAQGRVAFALLEGGLAEYHADAGRE